MAEIVVRFVASKGFVGWGIRAATGSLFQHTELQTPQGTWIGAHIGGGIQERPADYYKATLDYRYSIPCSSKQLADLMAWARAKIGTKYNSLDILGLLIQNRTLHTPNRFICSQFVTDGLIYIFGASQILNVLSPDWTYRITPETLHLSPIFVGRRTAVLK